MIRQQNSPMPVKVVRRVQRWFVNQPGSADYARFRKDRLTIPESLITHHDVCELVAADSRDRHGTRHAPEDLIANLTSIRLICMGGCDGYGRQAAGLAVPLPPQALPEF